MVGRMLLLLRALFDPLTPTVALFIVVPVLFAALVTIPGVVLSLPGGALIPLVCATPVLLFLAVYFALARASRIFTRWYETPEEYAFDILVSHAFGVGYPKVKAARGKLDFEDDPYQDKEIISVKMKAGVPVILTVDSDTAVLTELGGKPYGVYVEPGDYTLLPFERIRHAVDRRPQRAIAENVRAVTNDAIEVRLQAQIGYQIRRAGRASIRNPYPVDQNALYQATYKRAITSGEKEPARLREVVPAMFEGVARDVIAKYPLDALYGTAAGKTRRAEIEEQISEALVPLAAALGLEITSVAITKLDVVDEKVRERMHERWWKEQQHKLQVRMSPDQAKRKADEIAIMLETLEVSKAGEDINELVNSLNELRDLMDDIVALGEERDRARVPPVRGYRRYGFSDRERQRIFSDFAKDELYEVDEIAEDEEIARQFPGLATADAPDVDDEE